MARSAGRFMKIVMGLTTLVSMQTTASQLHQPPPAAPVHPTTANPATNASDSAISANAAPVQAAPKGMEQEKYSLREDWREIIRSVRRAHLRNDSMTVLSDVKAVLARQLPFWDSISTEELPSALKFRDSFSIQDMIDELTQPQNETQHLEYAIQPRESGPSSLPAMPKEGEEVVRSNNIRRTLDVSGGSRPDIAEQSGADEESTVNQKDTFKGKVFQRRNGAGNSDVLKHDFSTSFPEDFAANLNENVRSFEDKNIAIVQSDRVLSTTRAPPLRMNSSITTHGDKDAQLRNETQFDNFIPSVRWPPKEKKVTTKKPIRLNLVSFNRKPTDENSSLESSKRVAILHIPEGSRASEALGTTVDQDAQGSQMSSTSILPHTFKTGHAWGQEKADRESGELEHMSKEQQHLPEAMTPFLIIPQTGKTIPLQSLFAPELSRILAAERRQDINPLHLLVRPFRNILGLRSPPLPQTHHQFGGEVANRAIKFNSVSLNSLPPGNFIIEFGPPKGDDIVTSVMPEPQSKTRGISARQKKKASQALSKAPTTPRSKSIAHARPHNSVFLRQSGIAPNFPRLPSTFDAYSQSIKMRRRPGRAPLQSSFNFRTGEITDARSAASSVSSNALPSPPLASTSATLAGSGTLPSAELQQAVTNEQLKLKTAQHKAIATQNKVKKQEQVFYQTAAGPGFGFGHPQHGSILTPDTSAKALDVAHKTAASVNKVPVATTKRLPPLMAGRYQYPKGTSKPGRVPWPNTAAAHDSVPRSEQKRGKEIGSSYTDYSLPTTTRRPSGFSLPDLSMFNPFKYLFSSRSSSDKQGSTTAATTQSNSFNIFDWFTGQSRSDIKVDDLGPELPFSAGLAFPSPFLGVSAQIRNKSPAKKETRYRMPMTVPDTNTGSGDHYNDKYKMPQTVPGTNTGNGDHYSDQYVLPQAQPGGIVGNVNHYREATEPDVVFRTGDDKNSPMYYVVNPEALGDNEVQQIPLASPHGIDANQLSPTGEAEISSYSSIKRNLRRGKAQVGAVPQPPQQMFATKTKDGKIKLPTSFFTERLQQLRAHFSHEDLQPMPVWETLSDDAALPPAEDEASNSNAINSGHLPELHSDLSLFKTQELNTQNGEAAVLSGSDMTHTQDSVTWDPPSSSFRPISGPIIEVAPQTISTDAWSVGANPNGLPISVFARRMGEGDSVYVDDVMDELNESDEPAHQSNRAAHERAAPTGYFAQTHGNDDEYYFGLKKTINHIPISKALHRLSGGRNSGQVSLPAHEALTQNISAMHNKSGSTFNAPEGKKSRVNIPSTTKKADKIRSTTVTPEPDGYRRQHVTKTSEPNLPTVTKQYKVDAGPQSVNFTRVKWGFWQAADMDNRPAAIELQKITKPVFQLQSTQSEAPEQDPMSAQASGQSIVIVKAIPMNEKGVALTTDFESRRGQSDESHVFENRTQKNLLKNEPKTPSDRKLPFKLHEADTINETADAESKILPASPSTKLPPFHGPKTTTTVAHSWRRPASTTTPESREPKSKTRNDLFIPGFHDRKKKKVSDASSTPTTAKVRRTFPRSYYTTRPRPTLNATDMSSMDTPKPELASPSRQLVPHAKFTRKFTRQRLEPHTTEERDPINVQITDGTEADVQNGVEEVHEGGDGQHVGEDDGDDEKYEIAESQRIETHERPNALRSSQGKRYMRKRKPISHPTTGQPSGSASSTLQDTHVVTTVEPQKTTKTPMVSELAGFLNNTAEFMKNTESNADEVKVSHLTTNTKPMNSSVQKFFPLTVQPSTARQELTTHSPIRSFTETVPKPIDGKTEFILPQSAKLHTNVDSSELLLKEDGIIPLIITTSTTTSRPKSQTFFDRIRSRLAAFRSKSQVPQAKASRDPGSPRSLRGTWLSGLAAAAGDVKHELNMTQQPHITPTTSPTESKTNLAMETKAPLKSIADHFNAMRRRNKQLLNFRRRRTRKNKGVIKSSDQKDAVTTTEASDWPTNIKTLGLTAVPAQPDPHLPTSITTLTNGPRSKARTARAFQSGKDNSKLQRSDQQQPKISPDIPEELSNISNQHLPQDYEVPQYHHWEPAKI